MRCFYFFFSPGHEQLSQPRDINSFPSSRPTHNGKHRISRTRFSTYQKVALESSFLSSLYLTGEERDALAFKLGLSPVTVQVSWGETKGILSGYSTEIHQQCKINSKKRRNWGFSRFTASPLYFITKRNKEAAGSTVNHAPFLVVRYCETSFA